MTADQILSRCIPDADCLLWPGALSSGGYGAASIGGRLTPVHRAVFGTVPQGHALYNQCGEKTCCNPAHWIAAPRSSDVARASVARNQPRLRHASRIAGERHPCAKLTEAQVRAVRASSAPSIVLASALSVSRRTIERIRSLKSWRCALPIVG